MLRVPAVAFFLLFHASAFSADSVTHLSNIYRAPITEDNESKFLGLGQFHEITQPVAVGAHAHFIYFADAFKNLVYRFDRDQETLTPLYETEKHLQGPISAFYVNPDLSFYAADSFGKQVLYFSANGRLLNRFTDRDNLSTPKAVVFDAATSNLLVADSLFNHVIVFSPLGRAITAFGNRGTNRAALLHLVDMAQGREGIYLLDQINKSIYIFNEEGGFRRSQPRNEVMNPTALAVDRYGRIYISDAFDDSIKVYDNRGHIETIGGTGSADGMFRGITDIYIDRHFMYVADSGNNRIQVFIITPDLAAEDEL